MTDLSNLSDLLEFEEIVDVIEQPTQQQNDVQRPMYRFNPSVENNEKFMGKPKYYTHICTKKK